MIIFNALGTEELTRIVSLQVARLAKRLADRRLVLEVTPAAEEWLALTGFDPVYGARPLRRLVQSAIGDQLARALIAGEIRDGDRVVVDVDDDKSALTVVVLQRPRRGLSRGPAVLREHRRAAGLVRRAPRDGAELIVGFWRKETGRQTYSWSDAVDQALCFGWIDGVRRRIDDLSFSNRFTPRRPGSNWSDLNLAKVEALAAAGLMYPAGIAAHANRILRTAAYSFEQPAALALDPLQIKEFQRTQGGLGLLREQVSVLPQAGDLVGGQRQAGGDPRSAAGQAHRAVCRAQDHVTSCSATRLPARRSRRVIVSTC